MTLESKLLSMASALRSIWHDFALARVVLRVITVQTQMSWQRDPEAYTPISRYQDYEGLGRTERTTIMDEKKTQKFRQRLLEEYQKLIRSINRNRLTDGVENLGLQNRVW